MRNSKFVFTNLILVTVLLVGISLYISLYADSVAVITGYFFATAVVPVLITMAVSFALFTVIKKDLSLSKRYFIFAIPIISVGCLQILVYWMLQNGQH